MSDVNQQLAYLAENLDISDSDGTVIADDIADEKHEEKKKRFEMLGLDIDTLGHGSIYLIIESIN